MASNVGDEPNGPIWVLRPGEGIFAVIAYDIADDQCKTQSTTARDLGNNCSMLLGQPCALGKCPSVEATDMSKASYRVRCRQ